MLREREREIGYRRRGHLGDFEVVVFEGAEDHGIDGVRGGGRGPLGYRAPGLCHSSVECAGGAH